MDQILTEQSQEDLLEIICDYLSRTYRRVTEPKRVLIAEAVITIFPIVFGEDYVSIDHFPPISIFNLIFYNISR